jgi:hypothetical protein
MELDELKGAWAQYDKKLSDSLKLNEELLKKGVIDRSSREMKTPLNYEIGTVIITCILVLFLGVSTYRFASEMKFLLPGLVATILTLSGLISSVKKINVLAKIDYYNTSVVALQKSIHRIQQKAIWSRKVEYYVFPLYFISFAPIFVKAVYNIDIYNKYQIFYVGIILALIIYYPLAIWFYSIGYDKKLKNTSDFLNELNKFEKE